jgi:hypothetical protein
MRKVILITLITLITNQAFAVCSSGVEENTPEKIVTTIDLAFF